MSRRLFPIFLALAAIFLLAQRFLTLTRGSRAPRPLSLEGARKNGGGVPCPVVGLPVSPGMLDFVKRFTDSIDTAVDTFVVILNGEDNATLEWAEALVPSDLISRVIIVHAPKNLGVAGATNRILYETPDAPFWVISNNDIAFAPGALANLCAAAREAPPQAGSLHPVMLTGVFPHRDHGWSCFVLLHSVVERFGVWDENLYPAYAEDGDYETRLYGAGLEMIRVPAAAVYHGPGDSAYLSGTERSMREKRHPFFERVLAQRERADREAYTAMKFEAWAQNYNADAILHWKLNRGIFGWKPLYGAKSGLWGGFWAFDPSRRLCILDGGEKGPCRYDRAYLNERNQAQPSVKVWRSDLLTSWNGADACSTFSACLEKFLAQPVVLRVVVKSART
jgi:hypothetical protein